MQKKNKALLCFTVITFIIISLAGIILYLCMKLKEYKQKCKKKLEACKLDKKEESRDPERIPMITEYRDKREEPSVQERVPMITEYRDRRVINDPLYPPLNRSDRQTFESNVFQTQARNINVPTRDMYDSFRLVGYLTCKDDKKDAGGNHWKLMARQKNRHESEFYMIPTNKDYDVKVPLTSDVVVGTNLRDIYTIPNVLSFRSPMLNQSPYDFVELPKTSFQDSQYY